MKRADLEACKTSTLLRMAEDIARTQYAGHLTLLRFTTHWKAAFGTPCMYSAEGAREVGALPGLPTLKQALVDLLMRERTLYPRTEA